MMKKSAVFISSITFCPSVLVIFKPTDLPISQHIFTRATYNLALFFIGKDLYKVICELVPKLKTRQGGGSGGSEHGGGGGSGSSGGGGSAGTKKKKKGRK